MNELLKREQQEVKTASPEVLIDAGNAFSPDVDIYDTGEALIIVADVPGVQSGDVKVEIDENDVLSLRAKSSFEEDGSPSFRQYNAGNYFRSFSLSDEFNKDALAAKLSNGVLEITIPRREEVKPRTIAITA